MIKYYKTCKLCSNHKIAKSEKRYTCLVTKTLWLFRHTVQRSLQFCINLHFEPFLKAREQTVIIQEENYEKKEKKTRQQVATWKTKLLVFTETHFFFLFSSSGNLLTAISHQVNQGKWMCFFKGKMFFPNYIFPS